MRLTVLLFGLLSLSLAACGTTTTTCSPATCGGCCASDGQCLEGTADSACGTQGLNCNVCVAGQACVAQRCEAVHVDPPDAGRPLNVPVEVWTWQDFPDSACGNGQPTGIGVNQTFRSKDLFIYLQGGGACWDGLTCILVGSATNIDTGYGAADFANDGTTRAPPFNRTNSQNPLKDMSYVYVPYCTGDVHGGDAVQTYTWQAQTRTVHHKGGKNMDAYLLRLFDTFPDAQRVFVSGSSAGAFGAQLNYERIKRTWPNAEVHVLADCGQMINPAAGLLPQWLASWNFTIPAECADCATDFTKFPAYLAQKYPQSRFGLLAYTQDGVLRQFFGLDGATFQARTEGLLTSAYDGRANARYFVLPGGDHVMLGNLTTITGPGSTPLLTWTSRWVRGDALWANEKP